MPASRVVTGCLRLLEDWAAKADRTRRQDAGLAAYCHTLGREQISALLDKAGWQQALFPSSARPVPVGLSIPGGRLLSGQLRRIERILRERDLTSIRLARGALHLSPEAEVSACEAIRHALHSQ